MLWLRNAPRGHRQPTEYRSAAAVAVARIGAAAAGAVAAPADAWHPNALGPADARLPDTRPGQAAAAALALHPSRPRWASPRAGSSPLQARRIGLRRRSDRSCHLLTIPVARHR